MKKPAQPVIPLRWGTIGGSGAAQPGNAPGRGKAAHAKPAAKKKVPPKVKAKRHAAAVKAAKTRAANAKKAKHHPRRQLALGEGVACCSAEALAASLRLLGHAVSDEDVLALYWRTAADADAGASVLATLEAASRFGLAGVRLSQAQCMRLRAERNSVGEAEADRITARTRVLPGQLRLEAAADAAIVEVGAISLADLGIFGADLDHALILGVGLPGPHAVLATADGWWSWGGLYEPWTDDIDEAWEVTWT